jgi:hypothetical protein
MGVLTVQNIADRTRRQFGDTGSVLITDQAIFDWINDAMQAIVLDQKLLRLRATANTVVNQQNYAFPVDTLKVDHISFDGTPLNQTTTQEVSRVLSNMDDATNITKGIPSQYWLYGREIFLYPVPNVVKVLTIYYYRNPVLVTAVGNTPELPAEYDNRLVEYCLAQAAELDDDLNKQQLKLEQFTQGLNKTKDEQHGAQDFYPSMGVPLPDSYGYDYMDDC